MGEGGTGVKGAKAGQGPTLVSVDQADHSGYKGEAGRDDPFQDLRNSLKEDYDPEGRGGGVVGLARFGEDDAIGSFQHRRVVAIGDQRAEQVEEEGGIGMVDCLPDPIGYLVRARGRRVGGLAEGTGYLLSL